MEYFLYVLDTDKRIECDMQVLYLSKDDRVYLKNNMYVVVSKYIDYVDGFVDINVYQL